MAGTGAENRQQEENKQSGQGESSSVQEERGLNAGTSSPLRGRDTFGGGHSPPPQHPEKGSKHNFEIATEKYLFSAHVLEFLQNIKKEFKVSVKKTKPNQTKPSPAVLSHIILAPPYQQCVTYITRLAFIRTMHSDSKGYVRHVNKKRGIKCTLKNRAAQKQENLKS